MNPALLVVLLCLACTCAQAAAVVGEAANGLSKIWRLASPIYQQRAGKLLALHTDATDDPSSGSIGDDVRELKPVKALAGKGRFDVLELEGYVYKATYRMHFIYAQMEGCVLMGQEIIEVADPY